MKNMLRLLSIGMKNLRIRVAFLWRSALAAGFAFAVAFSTTSTLAEENPELSRAVKLSSEVVKLIESRRYADAIPLAKEVLAIREKALGPFHPATTASLNILVKLYEAVGSHAKAKPLITRAAELSRAVQLNNQGLEFYKSSRYTDAIPLAKELLAIREKVLGPEHPETATTINNLARLYIATSNYAKAEPLYKRTLAIHEKALGPEHPATAQSINDLASLYADMGNRAKAEPFYKRALAIREKALGTEHLDTAQSINNLASLYADMGNCAKAEPLLERALAIHEKALGPEHPNTALSLNNLAELYNATGDYAKAEPLYTRALAIWEKTLGPGHPDMVQSLGNLAELYRATSNYAKAEPLLERALAIREKTLGPEHLDTAVSRNNLAMLYETMGNYAKAEPLLERVLAIREKALGLEQPGTAASLNNLALLYNSMGNYAKAEPLFQRALAIHEKALGREHQNTALSLNNLAELYRNTSNYAKAEPLYTRALAICEKTLGPDHPDTAQSLGNLAGLYQAMHNYTKAEPFHKRALAIHEKTLGPKHPDTATSLHNLAILYSATGNYAKAEPLFERALTIYEKAFGPEHSSTVPSLHNLALLQLYKAKPAEALKLASRAEQAKEKTLANVLSFSSEQQRSEFQKTQHPYNLPATLGDAPLIGRTLLHWKGVVLDSILEDRAVARTAEEKGLDEQLAAMKSIQAQLQKLTLETPKDTSEAGLRSRAQQREKLCNEVEKMEAALARNAAALGQSRRALEMAPAQVQSALDSQEALVEFIRYDHDLGKIDKETRYGAVIFTQKGALQWVALGAAEDIEKTIHLYQKSARNKTDEATLQTTLHGLHGKIWAAIEKTLPANTKSVILCPDAELNFVSFATLLGEDDRFLAEKYSLRYVSSGRDLLGTPAKESSSTQKPVAVYGNPDFLLSRTGIPRRPAPAPGSFVAMRAAEIIDFRNIKLPPLAGTAAECEALAKMAKQTGGPVEIKTGAEASEAALQQLKSPRVLHLATHGFFLPEMELGDSAPGIRPAREIPKGKLVNPMHRSGLALAGAQTTLEAWGRGEVPTSENDGILTAEEVGTLNLAGTWLVTLSACETGSGQARAGEGVLGLRRGFIQAGAQNLLMTLWPISDETTVQIMLDFYSRAFASGNAPESLVEVQRKWLVKLRKEKGLLHAVNRAGPFIMNTIGHTQSAPESPTPVLTQPAKPDVKP